MMALYVCKCGGRNAYCTTCWGNRYYTPKEATKEANPEVPAPREESQVVDTLATNETEATDVHT